MGIQENIEHSAAERAKFREMKEGTAEDWAIIGGEYRAFAKGLPDRVLDHLKLLDGDFGGFPVCRLEHSLQTATRAHRDGRDEQYVVMAKHSKAYQQNVAFQKISSTFPFLHSQ